MDSQTEQNKAEATSNLQKQNDENKDPTEATEDKVNGTNDQSTADNAEGEYLLILSN